MNVRPGVGRTDQQPAALAGNRVLGVKPEIAGMAVADPEDRSDRADHLGHAGEAVVNQDVPDTGQLG